MPAEKPARHGGSRCRGVGCGRQEGRGKGQSSERKDFSLYAQTGSLED